MAGSIAGYNERARITARAKAVTVDDNLICITNCIYSAGTAADLILHIHARVDRTDCSRRRSCRASAFFYRQSNRWSFNIAADRADSLNKTGRVHLTRAYTSKRAIDVVTKRDCRCIVRNDCRRLATTIYETWL